MCGVRPRVRLRRAQESHGIPTRNHAESRRGIQHDEPRNARNRRTSRENPTSKKCLRPSLFIVPNERARKMLRYTYSKWLRSEPSCLIFSNSIFRELKRYICRKRFWEFSKDILVEKGSGISCNFESNLAYPKLKIIGFGGHGHTHTVRKS